MSESNRYLFAIIIGYLTIAVVSWVLLRPPPFELTGRQDQKAQRSAYSPGSPRCYPSRISSLPAGEASDERYRCEQAAEEYRLKSDDLVQQTRAADAAYAIVDLTYRQTLISLAAALVGLLTLGAAVYAAWYARRAAEETGRGAEAAEGSLTLSRNVSKAELRPWIATECAVKRFQADDKQISCEYEIVFSNLGKTEAQEFYIATANVVTGDDPTELVTRFFQAQRPPRAHSKSMLMPNRSHATLGTIVEFRRLIKWRGRTRPREARIVCMAVAFYRSPFDRRWRRSCRSFLIGLRDQGSPSYPRIREDLMASDATDIVVTSFGPGEDS